MPRPSSLTQTEEALLKACLAEYRSTPATQKDAFHNACARYILWSCQLDEANELLLELFSAKVRNWFQNNTPTETKHVHLPLRINQSFHPLRIFGHKNRDLVRKTLAKENAAAPSDTRAYIVQWNETVRRLWDKLSEEEQRPYVRLAKLWSVQGPDDDLKPWMAERRSGSWFHAIAHMLWVQCGMPVFIYGMFKDTNGKLQATVYDTTELWAESQPSMPLFWSIKDWDHDFRRTIWTFLQAILDPTQASRDTLKFVQVICRQPPTAVTFERYSDGTPIMPKEPKGSEKKGQLTSRRQQILWEYLRIHYSHATGHEAKSVPWQSIREAPEKFFDPGMLSTGFNMQDPSKITDDELNTLFTHISKMEQCSDGEPNRFHFSSYETGPKGNHSYHPAIYSGSIEAAEPRHPKKSIHILGFEGPPSDGESEGTRLLLPPPMKATGVNVLPGSRMHIALDADFAKVTAALAAASVNSGASTPEPAEPGKRGENPASGSKGKQRAVQPWVEAQVNAAGAATTGWSEGDDELLDNLWVLPRSIDDDVPNDLSFASDDEGWLPTGLPSGFDTLLDDAIRDLSGTSSSVPPEPLLPPAPLGTLPEVSAIPPSPVNAKSSATHLVRCPSHALASPVALEAVERDGECRLAYIRQLADDVPYQDLIRLMEAEIREVVTIRGKAPVMWGTWGLKSVHVPKTIQESEKNVNSLLNWIKKGIPQVSGPADIQWYCLVAGLILSDLDFIEDTTGVDQWLEDLPGFLVYSELNGEHCDLVLRACKDIVTARKCSDADVTHTAPLASGSIPKAA